MIRTDTVEEGPLPYLRAGPTRPAAGGSAPARDATEDDPPKISIG